MELQNQSTGLRFTRRLRSWVRSLTHAGIPASITQIEERQLVTGNIVVLLAMLVTGLTVPPYFTENKLAATYAGISSLAAFTIYGGGFLLIALGQRFAGLLLFTNTVLMNLAILTLLLGTKCGVQYYFVAVGMGAVLVWPPAYLRIGLTQAVVGLALFIIAMLTAGLDPIVGPPLSAGFVKLIFLEQISGAYIVAFAIVFYAIKTTELAESALETERAKSESLLLNILPEAIATRLKTSTQSIADGFEEVTILFADVVGFTPMSSGLPPAQVVDFLNQLFTRFDLLAERHGLEKIKTIGDAYMVAGGIPVMRDDHAKAVVEMALGMTQVMHGMQTPDGKPVQLRIGICTGPVTAGVIGIKKFAYDLWGDTVNTASRMESHGVPGMVQVTESTYRILSNDYEFEKRGTVEVKGKGPMELYLVRGPKSVH